MTYDCPRCARPFPQHRPQLKPQEAHMFPCHLGQNTSASLLLLFLYNIPRCFTWETRQIPCQSFCLGRRVLLLRLVLMESERDRSKARSPKPFFFPVAHVSTPMVLTALAEDIAKSPGVCVLTVLLTFLTYMTLGILHRDPGR